MAFGQKMQTNFNDNYLKRSERLKTGAYSINFLELSERLGKSVWSINFLESIERLENGSRPPNTSIKGRVVERVS